VSRRLSGQLALSLLHKRVLWLLQSTNIAAAQRLQIPQIGTDTNIPTTPSTLNYPETPNPHVSTHELAAPCHACSNPCIWSFCCTTAYAFDTCRAIREAGKGKQMRYANAIAWGLEARDTVMAVYVVFYCRDPCTAFRSQGWWLEMHPVKCRVLLLCHCGYRGRVWRVGDLCGDKAGMGTAWLFGDISHNDAVAVCAYGDFGSTATVRIRTEV
jgi:hypothetical protein